MFFLKNGPFRLLRAPIDVEWSQESKYGLRIFFYPLAGFLKMSILGLTGFTSTHRCEGPPKNEKKKKTNSFWKTEPLDHANVRGVFKGSLGGSYSGGPVAIECVEKILWDDFWKSDDGVI